MVKENIKLSIIIAAYNVELYIYKCVLSCIKQDLDSALYEIVVVNDGSTDSTLEILNGISANCSNIKIITQQNSGLGSARNSGIQISKGDYLWFIDGDDYLQENIIQAITNKIAEYKLDILVLNFAIVNELYQITRNYANTLRNIENVITGSQFYETNYTSSYSSLFIFSRVLFTNNNIQFKERINMQDSEILPKLMYYTKRLAYLDKVCYYYVQQANSFTNSNIGEIRFTYFESIIAVRDSLNKFLNTKAKDDQQITTGIRKKIKSLHQVVFNHLVFFPYEKENLLSIFALLKANGLYPLQYKAKGKMIFVRAGLNWVPVFTKKIIDLFRKNYSNLE